MLNIVHLGKYYLPDAGGIESVTLSLSKGAAQAGHKVTVVCFKKNPANNADVIDGVRVFRAPIRRFISSQPISLKYVMLCLREARHADVVHLHAPNMLAAVCGLFIGRKKQLLVHWHSDVIGKGFLSRILKPLEISLLKRANRIVATSQIYADASATLRPFQSKISVVPIGVPEPNKTVENGLNTESFLTNLASTINGKKIILAVGRLVSYKGLNVLIEAARHLDDGAVIVIVGDGPQRESLMRVICAADVSDRVLLVGRLSDEALHALFSCSTLYCLPSITRAEAFGVVLLEAMAYGLPIVATNIPGSGVPWVNQHGLSGINVPVSDPLALANACNHILNSPGVRARLSTGARQRYLCEFKEGVSVSRMLTIYNSMTGVIP
ncbi:MAG: glycosyltransferase [Thiobacillaceae bacterium]